MTDKMNAEAKARRERLQQIYGALNIYGSNDREELFLNSPDCKRRYAALGRKILAHYAGDKYNPHTVEFHVERYIRIMIEGFVQAKVLYKHKGYDWEYIDNFFKKVVSFSMEINIPYDQKRLDAGINPAIYTIPVNPHPTKQ